MSSGRPVCPKPVGPPVWGDGFEGDTWRDLAVVRSWDACTDEEMIRVFPLLARRTNVVPARLMRRITDCVAALAWQTSSCADRRYRPASIDAETVETHGRALAWDWFADGSSGWRFVTRRQAFDRPRAFTALLLIDALAEELAAGTPRAFDPRVASELVYWSGVHPVYIWPEALLGHALYTAIGWIGHAERSGRALMTPDIADYFTSVLGAGKNGIVEPTDPQLVPYLKDGRAARVVLKAAQRRVGGRSTVVKWPRGPVIAHRFAAARADRFSLAG